LGLARDTRGVDHLQDIVAIVLTCGAAVLFALMAWAGQHQS
jgi:hypothetical protein